MIKLLLLALKAGKLGKFALTGGTLVLSVIAYAWMFGWQSKHTSAWRDRLPELPRAF